MHKMRRMQVIQRITHHTDYYVAETNNEYVMYHSICLGIIIVISSLVQTYFIKKLFRSPANSIASSKDFKPRA